MRKRKLDYNAIYQEHLNGLSYDKISKKFNCSKNGVAWVILKKKNPKKAREENTNNSKKYRAKLDLIESLKKQINSLQKENLKMKTIIDNLPLAKGVNNEF